jgi:hypothetical protein
MLKLFFGFLMGLLSGCILGRALPVWMALSVCVALCAAAVLLFALLPLGISDCLEV